MCVYIQSLNQHNSDSLIFPPYQAPCFVGLHCSANNSVSPSTRYFTPIPCGDLTWLWTLTHDDSPNMAMFHHYDYPKVLAPWNPNNNPNSVNPMHRIFGWLGSFPAVSGSPKMTWDPFASLAQPCPKSSAGRFVMGFPAAGWFSWMMWDRGTLKCFVYSGQSI